MHSLTATLFLMMATTAMGVAVVIALLMGWQTWPPLALAASIGFLVAVPVSRLVARRLS